jgi:hypothetical protein
MNTLGVRSGCASVQPGVQRRGAVQKFILETGAPPGWIETVSFPLFAPFPL